MEKEKKQAKQDELTDEGLARLVWARYDYARKSGHDKYRDRVKTCEDFYLGGGRQWTDAERSEMKRNNRLTPEFNYIMPAVQTATGVQMHTRVDIDIQPRGGGADQETATVLTKLIRQLCYEVDFHWKESQVFEDGLIQQRGYFDFRVDFAENFQGKIICDILDPLDVMPDPDATSYNPDDWNDVIVERWLTYDEISARYGIDKADRIKNLADEYFADDDYLGRPRFNEDADGEGYEAWVLCDDKEQRSTRLYLVLDRQSRHFTRGEVVVTDTGEVFPVNTLTPEQHHSLLLNGGFETVLDHFCIRWVVTCAGEILHDDISPYKTKTIIPYFNVFRRGKTTGMVDNLISPQQIQNKAIANSIEIMTTTANSGWDIEESSLVGMTPKDLETQGSKNGIVLTYKKGSTPPSRRQPNQVPTALDNLGDRSALAIDKISGMNDAVRGATPHQESGIASANRAYQGEKSLGRAFDNLNLTRKLCAKKMLELIQQYYTEERIVKIIDPETNKVAEEIVINQADEYGNILNDVTVGSYDIIITETPTHASFLENQFTQMMAMRERGVMIPDSAIIRASQIANKTEIIEEIANTSQQSDPVAEAEANLKNAQTDKVKAETDKVVADTINSRVEAQFAGVQTAGVVAQAPAVAPLADQILRSAGFEDMDAPPIVPSPHMDGMYPEDTNYPKENYMDNQALGHVIDEAVPNNTSPMFPTDPNFGQREGIETADFEPL